MDVRPTQTLIPHATVTPQATLRPVSRAAPPTTPGPTATPLTHVVGQNETLLGIASEYGVSLEALIAANPGVNPRFLTIGQGLIIPGPDGQPVTSLLPTSTPIPLDLVSLDCYPTPSDSLWCLATVVNSTGAVLEGVSGIISLVGADGEIAASAVASSPVNLLPEGKVMALSAYFPPSAPGFAAAQLEMRSAVTLPEGDDRYVDIGVTQRQDVPGPENKSITVRGVLASAEQGAFKARVAVVALGLDSRGAVVGYARWEKVTEIAEGSELPFDVTVISLGPPMKEVVLFAESLRVLEQG
jgi:LysM repeat protein